MALIRLPGLIDPHVHLREPGGIHKEDFFTGTRAALRGGITMVLAMPNTSPPLIDGAALNLAEEGARTKAVCDYGIHLGGASENHSEAISLAHRVTGLKLYLDATFGPLLLKDLKVVHKHFAEWPKEKALLCHAEEMTLASVLALAHVEQRSVHIVHVSKRSEIELIRKAKEKGIQVTCEVCPHHLFLSTDDISRIGEGRSEVRPRLTSPDDVKGLWEHLSVVDCFATDHAPHLLQEKDSTTPPPGFPGLESMLPLLLHAVHEGKLEIKDVVTKLSTNTQRIFSLPEQENTFVEVDPDSTTEHRGAISESRAKWSPFEGWVTKGKVVKVVLRGKEVFNGEEILASPGEGKNVCEG